MQVDWVLIKDISIPVATLFIGAVLDRAIERKPNLIAYFNHASAFDLTGTNPLTVHTHGIVIRNIGKKTATDVRVRHHVLPKDFKVFPVIQHHVETLPSGGQEIVFPELVPFEQVTISYLYFPPLIYSQIHAGIRHNQGFATEVTALPTPQYPAWMLRILRFLLLLGLVGFIYFVCEFLQVGIRTVQFFKMNGIL